MFSAYRAKWLPMAALLILVLAGCSGRHESNEHYYLVAANVQVPYWQTAKAGLEAAAAQMQIHVDFVGPETYDPKAEQQEFQKLVKLSPPPAGIMVSPADPNLMKADIDAAIAQGIPVVTMDSDAPASKRLFFIGTNNYQAGLVGGEALVKAMNGKGTVVVFTMPGQVNLDERLQGYRNALEKSGIKIDRVVDIKGDPRVVFDTTDKIVNDPKEKARIDGFVCLEAQGGKEVASVLNQNHVTGKTVVAMDTDQDTLDAIRKGLIVATVGQKPYTMAFVGLKMLDDLYHYKPSSLSADWKNNSFSPVPQFVDTGLALIDKNNLEGFMADQKQAVPGKK